jgi:hypothetical protein
MPRDFHRPTQFPSAAFEAFQGGDDPATVNRIAHESAAALVARVKHDPQPEILDRLVSFSDEHGIDVVAELWARAAAHTLPGALWRIYLVRAVIRQAPEEVTFLFDRGVESSTTIDPIVAGAPTPATPAEVLELADLILRGVFDGDFHRLRLGLDTDPAGAPPVRARRRPHCLRRALARRQPRLTAPPRPPRPQSETDHGVTGPVLRARLLLGAGSLSNYGAGPDHSRITGREAGHAQITGVEEAVRSHPANARARPREGG